MIAEGLRALTFGLADELRWKSSSVLIDGSYSLSGVLHFILLHSVSLHLFSSSSLLFGEQQSLALKFSLVHLIMLLCEGVKPSAGFFQQWHFFSMRSLLTGTPIWRGAVKCTRLYSTNLPTSNLHTVKSSFASIEISFCSTFLWVMLHTSSHNIHP